MKIKALLDLEEQEMMPAQHGDHNLIFAGRTNSQAGLELN